MEEAAKERIINEEKITSKERIKSEEKITNEERVKIVQEFYNNAVQTEWERIVGKPEFLLTCRMMDRYIKPGDTVLDIGGGPGRYSFHLAEKGCDVTLFDLSPENINHANKHSTESGIPVKAICGDAREADKIINNCSGADNIDSGQIKNKKNHRSQNEEKQFDHILLMGPLYHLLEEQDRIKAINAALKLLKPGGVFFAAFINLSGGMVFGLREIQTAFADPKEEQFLAALANRENYGGALFTQAFMINQYKVLPFMEQFGLEKLHLFGQEGVLAPNLHTFMEQTQEVKEVLLKTSENLYEKEEYLSWAEHLMYVGRKR